MKMRCDHLRRFSCVPSGLTHIPNATQPIHVPGAVQAWGVLMALEITEDGRFVVVQVSEVRWFNNMAPVVRFLWR